MNALQDGQKNMIAKILFAVILIQAIIDPFMEHTGYGGTAAKDLRIGIYFLCFGIQTIDFFNWRNPDRFRYLLAPIFAALLWCWLSLAWSSAPGTSLKQLALETIVTTVIMLSVARLGYRPTIQISRIVFGVLLAVNLAALLLWPVIGFEYLPDRTLWQGVMTHKNLAGLVCAITILLFALDAGRVPPAVRYAVLAGAAAFLIGSWSRTAMISLAVALPLGLVLARLGPDRRLAILRSRKRIAAIWATGFALAFVVLVTLTLEKNTLIGMTADTSAVSNRNTLWRPLVQYFVDNPWLGSGYGAYWTTPPGSNGAGAFGAVRWLKYVDQAHNGFLDIMVQTGLPGLVLAVGAAFVWPTFALGRMLHAQPTRAALTYALLAFCLIHNFTESSLLAGDAIGNVVLVTVLGLCARFVVISSRTGSSTMPPHRERRTAADSRVR